jgi:hypothetical protein
MEQLMLILMLLASLTFTGVPAPTATADTNSDQIWLQSICNNCNFRCNDTRCYSSVKGKMQLLGDLTGTADSPTIATDALQVQK